MTSQSDQQPASRLSANLETVEKRRVSHCELFLPKIQQQRLLRTRTTTTTTTAGEASKWFGVLVLIARFECGERAALWSAASSSDGFAPPASLGRTGMPRQRFDDLSQHAERSDQPTQRPEGMAADQHRWMLVDNFVPRFSAHRASHSNPSHLICVDESISR